MSAPSAADPVFNVRLEETDRPGVRRLWIEQPLDELMEREKAILERQRKETKMAGFRRGEAPLATVRRKYGQQARARALEALTRDSVDRALRVHNLVAVVPPALEETQVGDSHIRLRVRVEMPPDVDIDGYKGLQLKRKSIPVTEEMVDKTIREIGEEAVGAPAEFRLAIRKILGAEAERLVRRDLESQAVEALLQANSFDLPPSLVAEREQELLRRLHIQFQSDGGRSADWSARVKEYGPAVRQEAERGLRLAYILAAVAAAESISVTPEETTVAVRRAVRTLPDDHRARSLARLEAQKADVHGVMLEDKVFDYILANAVISAATDGVNG